MAKHQRALDQIDSSSTKRKRVAKKGADVSLSNPRKDQNEACLAKPVRQEMFVASSAGLSSKEIVAKARLIPDVSQASFKIVRICG